VDAQNIRNIVLMRPVNSMIEFKQIIGRGTRLFDGKDYFTIYDFVKAHQHFLDPEWDGEPEPPEAPEPCPTCGQRPCVCRKKVKVKLADGKERTIQHMTCTSFWHPDGTPMSAQQFMELLFGRLPEFFHDEDELRRIWSAPDTRKRLLQGLAEKGFGHDQLSKMQRIIDLEASEVADSCASHFSREVRLALSRNRLRKPLIINKRGNPNVQRATFNIQLSTNRFVER